MWGEPEPGVVILGSNKLLKNRWVESQKPGNLDGDVQFETPFGDGRNRDAGIWVLRDDVCEGGYGFKEWGVEDMWN